jgi:hypothetical protein
MVAPAATGALGAAGPIGWTPLLINAAMSFLPGLLSSLFGGKSSAQKEQERLAKEKQDAMDRIRALYDPAYRSKLQAKYYQQNLGSPAYSQAQGTIAAGANQAGSQIATSLGQSGLNQSGLGAVMSGMVPSMVGGKLATLRTSAYNAGGEAANADIAGQAQAIMQSLGLQGAPAGPSQTQQLLSGGMSAFAPYLSEFLSKKYTGTPKAVAPTAAAPASTLPYAPVMPTSNGNSDWSAIYRLLGSNLLGATR